MKTGKQIHAVRAFMQFSKHRTLFSVCFVVLLLGCDPTRAIHQSVRLSLSGTADNDLNCETVAIRQVVKMTDTDKRRERVSPGRFNRLYPWIGPNAIGHDKQVEFTVVRESITNFDNTVPPRANHPFTNNRFEIKLEGCKDELQLLQIDMIEGNSASNGHFQVDVISVSEARFVVPRE
jgi:hypothetical protein